MKVKHEAQIPIEDVTVKSIRDALGEVPENAKVVFRRGRWKDQRDYEKDHLLITWETN